MLGGGDGDNYIIRNVKWRCIVCGKDNEAPSKRVRNDQNHDVSLKVVERTGPKPETGDEVRPPYASLSL